MDRKEPKSVQIPTELFWRLCGYFLLGHRESMQEDIIKNELQAKYDAMERHNNYMANRKQGQ